jgi:hypothetical protein
MSRSPAFYPFVGLVLVTLFMIFASDKFLTGANLENIARQVSINAIIAVGMTCVILTGGIDLSVGPVMALSGTLTTGLMVAGVPAPVAIAAGLLVGVGFGVGNGIFVALLKMPPIIVTLATMGIARGLGLMYTDGYPISGMPEWFAWFGRGTLFGVQVPILIMLGTYLLAWVLLQHTRIGRYIYVFDQWPDRGGGRPGAVVAADERPAERRGRFRAGRDRRRGARRRVDRRGARGNPRHPGRCPAAGGAEQWPEHARGLALCAKRDQGRNHPAGDIHQPPAPQVNSHALSSGGDCRRESSCP